MGGKCKDMTGVRVGRLTVLSRAGSNNGGEATWLCSCDCGKTTIVRGASLRMGSTKSCGCLLSEATKERATKHGLSPRKEKPHKLYNVLNGMIQRCENPNSQYYKHYGGRGISVCKEWHDVEAFYKWATENGYKDGLTIDRIDNNGDYCPENCKWATRKEQGNNRRTNHKLTLNGETHNISEWAEITGIRRELLDSRIQKGWSDERVLTELIDITRSHPVLRRTPDV